MVSDETFKTLTARADLTESAFAFTYISKDTFDSLCQQCPYLWTLVASYVGPPLDLNGASVGDDHDALVYSLSTHCTELGALSLRKWCMTDTALVTLSSLTYLRELDLSGCSNITSGGVRSLLASLNGKLKKLTLTGSCIDTMLLRCIGDSCPKLTDLKLLVKDLGTSPQLIFLSLVYMIFKCSLLEIVDFGRELPSIGELVLLTLSQACHGLISLAVAGATYSGLRTLLTACPLLQSLNLIKMSPFLDPSLAFEDTPCPSLTSITLHSEYITDSQLCGLLKHCPNLQGLSLVCPLMSDETLLVLSQYCPKLKLIGIVCSSQVTSSAPLTGFAYLEHIDIEAELTEPTLAAFAVSCKCLRDASFRGCTGLSCEDVLRFIGSTPNLRKLEVGGCWSVEEGEALMRRVNAVYPRVTFGLAV